MSSVTPVPETAAMIAAELSAEDAWRTLRRAPRSVLSQAFLRFRYGDGFSHGRALGLQLCLAVIPLGIALVGLSGTLHTERAGQVLRMTLIELTPGPSDALLRNAFASSADEGGAAGAALWLGLVTALAALTSAMGQVERGANRIYGVQRDRPSLRKYGRALVMALAAGVPALAGFVALIVGPTVGDAVEQVYGADDDLVAAATMPASAALLVLAVTAMLRHSPHRRQPGWSWLALGAATAVVLWLVLTGLLAGYLRLSSAFGSIYGPLTGVMALLLWAQLTSMAVFFAVALTAQLEAARVGDPRCLRSSSCSARSRPRAR